VKAVPFHFRGLIARVDLGAAGEKLPPKSLRATTGALPLTPTKAVETGPRSLVTSPSALRRFAAFDFPRGSFEIFLQKKERREEFLERSTAPRRHFFLVTASAAEAARRNSQ
jgi:hypothetical protein